MLAPPLPDNFREMEPLFLAVISGCHAGLFREALHEVYISRIQRGDASFAANVLGARGALLSALVQFFEHGSWESRVKIGIGEHSLSAEDQLFILMQAGIYLEGARGLVAPEARICYERAESFCHSLNRCGETPSLTPDFPGLRFRDSRSIDQLHKLFTQQPAAH